MTFPKLDFIPLSIQLRQFLPDEFCTLVHKLATYVIGTEWKDFIEACIENSWTIDEARNHIFYIALIVNWHMKEEQIGTDCETYALEIIELYAHDRDYKLLNSSLKLQNS